ncbi:hypothetical protein [Bacillus infantis]|uniref:hypothetical protein n=1 Tax=Bacillus infantis TaxID=324767 RepID=UPI003CF6A604
MELEYFKLNKADEFYSSALTMQIWGSWLLNTPLQFPGEIPESGDDFSGLSAGWSLYSRTAGKKD